MNTQLEELACLYVLDRLEPAERAAFEARLLEDPELAALTRAFEGSLALRVGALPQHTPPATLAERIEHSIDQLESEAEPETLPVPVSLWSTIARWGIAAVVAGSVGTVAFLGLGRRPAAAAQPHMIIVGLDTARSTLAELPVESRAQNPDAQFIQLASLAQDYWDRPEDLPVKVSADGQTGRGYALFNPRTNQGFIAIRQLPAVEVGKRYHLWIVDTDSGKVREAGSLPLTASSRGLYFFSVPPTPGVKSDRLDFFVTAEDGARPDPTVPHGAVVLGDRRF